MTQSKPQTCLSDADLHRFLKEQIAEHEEASLQEHIGQCSACQAKMETIAAGQAMWDALREGVGEHVNGASEQTLDTDTEGAVEDPILAGLLDHLGPTEDPKYLGRLGSYEVCGVIGQGSTGIVLKALETRLNRFVAIKVLTPALASSGPARRRFEREGRAIAAVSHEHVVPIYSVDEHRGLPYIVMQYIPGLSLLQRIEKSGSLDTCEVTRIGYQVASALAAAHGQGIIHRDVKPANVLLHGSVDRAMVTDFGLARVSDDATMTRSGTISGTPQYMSPEQARGEVADARTDLFSLGSLMYAACTARAPFRAETVFGIIHRVCQTNPHPIRELNPDIAPWLCEFIDKLMAKQPEARFDSAGEAAMLLENELAHIQNPMANPEPKRDWIPDSTQEVAKSPQPLQPNEPTQPHQAAELAVAPATKADRRWGTTGLTMASMAVAIALAGYVGWKEFGSAFLSTDLEGRGSGSALIGEAPTGSNGNDVDFNSLSAGAGENGAADSGMSLASDTDGDSGRALSDEQSGEATDSTKIINRPKRQIESFVALPPGESRKETWTESEDQDSSIASSFTQRIDTSYELAEGARVMLNVDVGNVEVRQTELDYATFVVLRRIESTSRAEAEKIATYHTLTSKEGENLTLSAELNSDFAARGGEKRFEQITFGLAVPVGTNVELATKKGNITIDPLLGDVAAEAEAGDVRCGKIDGEVFARTVGGEIVVTEGCTGAADLMSTHGNVCAAGIEGGARLRSSDGSIYVGENPGTVSAHATGGDVRVSAAANKTNVHVEVGNVLVRLAKAPKGECRFSATSGNLDVEMPADSNVAIKTWERDEEGEESEEGGRWAEVALNDGSIPIELISTSGTVNFSTTEPLDDEALESLGGSGNEYFSLGGSGNHSEREEARAEALAKTSGEARPGAMVPIEIEDGHNIDGYTLYLPATYEADKGPYPVLVYMQGGYGVGGPVTNLNDWGLPRLIRDENDLSTERNKLLLDTFIVVSIHISDGRYDDHPEVVLGILNDVAEGYSTDPNRVYLTGLSAGGHASWNLIEKLPNTFAATVPIGGRPDFEKLGAFKNTAVWVAHNLGDPTVEWEDADEGAKAIEKALEIEFERYSVPMPELEQIAETNYLFTQPALDRHDAWTELYTSTTFYKWLLAHSLE